MPDGARKCPIIRIKTLGGEMDGDEEIAARYRQRAAEVRAIAETLTDEKAKKILIQVSDDYKQMARAMSEAAKAGQMRRP